MLLWYLGNLLRRRGVVGVSLRGPLPKPHRIPTVQLVPSPSTNPRPQDKESARTWELGSELGWKMQAPGSLGGATGIAVPEVSNFAPD